jgi:hypothetical protein
MRGRVAFLATDRGRRFLATIKFWRSAFLKNRAAVGSVGVGVVKTCPKNGTGGYFISPDDLGANEKPQEPPGSDVGVGMGIQATTYAMQTFHEFLAKKAMVLPNLFRIEPFIGLAQPIPLKNPTVPAPKKFRCFRDGEKWSKVR